MVPDDYLAFHPDTPPAVRHLLAKLCKSDTRVRVWCGDTATGRAWAEENDVLGTIGCSTGPMKVPLLVPRGARGGPHLLDHCVVRINRTEDGVVLYQHPAFHTGQWVVEPHQYLNEDWFAVRHEGELHARFPSEMKAKRYAAFMRGERNSK